MTDRLREFQTLTPAYGRDYKSKKEVLLALGRGDDFKLEPEGQYINLPQLLEAQGWRALNVRYKSNTQVAVVSRPDLVKAKAAAEGVR